MVTGSDSVAHMAEEVEDAGVVVPRAMVWSFIINIPFTFGLVISYLFCMPSVGDALADPTGFPFIYVFREATGSNGGTLGMTLVILFLITMITISAMASTSRQTFAFGRDKGLPFAAWIGRVSLDPSNSPPLPEILLNNTFAGSREMASPRQFDHLHRHLHHHHLSHQHRQHSSFQRHALPLHRRAHGNIRDLDRLRHHPPTFTLCNSPATISLDPWTVGSSHQHLRPDLRLLVLLLVFLAQLIRRHSCEL